MILFLFILIIMYYVLKLLFYSIKLFYLWIFCYLYIYTILLQSLLVHQKKTCSLYNIYSEDFIFALCVVKLVRLRLKQCKDSSVKMKDHMDQLPPPLFVCPLKKKIDISEIRNKWSSPVLSEIQTLTDTSDTLKTFSMDERLEKYELFHKGCTKYKSKISIKHAGWLP